MARLCFVGIGLPSAAANLARLTHAPDVVLIYESGHHRTQADGSAALDRRRRTFRDRPIPWSPFAEIFAYWLQGGRISLGFLGAAQIDRFANLNSDRDRRLTKSRIYATARRGRRSRDCRVLRRSADHAAPRPASVCGEIGLRHFARTPPRRRFSRKKFGLPGAGPTAVITDLCILTPIRRRRELTLTSVHPGVDGRKSGESDGLVFEGRVGVWPSRLRRQRLSCAFCAIYNERTARAHSGQA